jgi:hypothetical protein
MRLPKSLLFFLATAIVFALQTIPMVGIFLMFMLAMFWSVLLINAGMIGIAYEALTGRVARVWLVVPLLFYGGYWLAAANDHKILRDLGQSYDAANAKVRVPFDARQQALVFEDASADGGYVQNYNLPVMYARDSNFPEGARSIRMMSQEICRRVAESRPLREAKVYTFGFQDGDILRSAKIGIRFCDLTMPERPALPTVTVSKAEAKTFVGTLPVTQAITLVRTPEGRIYKLLGGVAAPLKWLPMPAMGCGLISSSASWKCEATFLRDGFTPIVSGTGQFGRDAAVLARALGLALVLPENRKGGDATLVLAKLAEVERVTRDRQLAALDAMIADPLMKNPQWDFGVISSQPDVLLTRADAVMDALERAAPVRGNDFYKGRESGRTFARLIASLPRERFVAYGPRILALYRANFDPVSDPSASRPESHWLWEAEDMLRLLGALGPDALPILVDPRASRPSVNDAGIEGLCRIGLPGRGASAPVLIDRWRSTKKFDRDERRSLFVAMRRSGIDVPPLPDGADQNDLIAEWGDISPSSPQRVCATQAEYQARREEKYSGRRRTNLD